MPATPGLYKGKTIPLYDGKTKREIAEEAFKILGSEASRPQVNRYFRDNYGIPSCETSMYYSARGVAKRQANGHIKAVSKDFARRGQTIRESVSRMLPEATLVQDSGTKDIPKPEYGKAVSALVKRTKELANDLGGFDKLTELIEALKQ